MHLTIEQQPGNADELFVFCDENGLETLINQLLILKKNGGHVHLMTPSWSGNELTEKKQVIENHLIKHLRITMNK